jgi:MFS family permease
MLTVFLNDYFATDRQMGVPLATLVMTLFGIGTVVGQLIGGLLGQYLYNKKPYYQCMLMGVSTTIGTFPMLYLINAVYTNNMLFYTMAFVAGLIIAITGPNVRAVLVVGGAL